MMSPDLSLYGMRAIETFSRSLLMKVKFELRFDVLDKDPHIR
jgi:hypothetical protein